MATVTVDRNLFGLVVVPVAGHPAVALLNRLPRHLCLRPLGGKGEYIVGLTAEALVPMRRLYRMQGVEFSAAAVEALKHLRATQDAMTVATAVVQRPRVDTAPQVSASLRGLPATLDPSSAGGTGQQSPGTTTVPSYDTGV